MGLKFVPSFEVKGPTLTASVLLLFFSLILGGGTHAGFLSDVILQVVAVPMLAVAIWVWSNGVSRSETAGGARSDGSGTGVVGGLLLRATIAAGVVIAAVPFVPGLQSVVSPGLSAQLASHGSSGLVASDPTAHMAARAAVVAALPAVVLAMLVSRLGEDDRIRLVGWMVAFGSLSLVLGIAQFAQGPTSGLRFFSVTNSESAVGFFANRNHFAAQLYVTGLLALVWFTVSGRRLFSRRKTKEKSQRLGWILKITSFYLLLAATIFMVQSRAGILLTLVGVCLALFLIRSIRGVLRGHAHGGSRVAWLIPVVVAAGLLGIGVLASDRLTARFEAGIEDQTRSDLTQMTITAAMDALPLGVGLGNFIPVAAVYQSDDTLIATFANRAHDDWAEFLLEAGIPAAVFLGLFVAWFVWSSLGAMFGRARNHGGTTQLLQRVSAIAILLLMLHSTVDYPLRTSGMLAYMVILCCFLAPPPRSLSGDEAREDRGL